MRTILLMFTVLIAVQFVYSAPFFFDDDFSNFEFDFSLPDLAKECANLGCPEGTTSCGKKTATSSDRKKIITELKCFDRDAKLTKDEKSEKENPNPDVQQYSFENFASSSNFEGSFNQSVNINNNSNKNPTTGGDVEDLTK